MSTDLYKKTVEFIRASSVVLDAAEKQASARDAGQKRAEERIPGCVERLIERGLIQDTLRKQASLAFGDHGKTLEFLEELATRVSPPAPPVLGAAEKTAASRSRRTEAYLNARDGQDDERESDRILFERFNVR